ncbi:C2H2-like zinc finger protein [Rhynchospora pubera]|uniref:C2H2-like zinc finger protein n=1 Tax=Rhynchospora pubera TaxID=906938 RepID=A0AAV8BVC3_9POAL|nr:C2H2-like zinc finger protein [Rhynchospora pubera]
MNPNPNSHVLRRMDDMMSFSQAVEAPSNTLINNISVLQDKIRQLESLAGTIVSGNDLAAVNIANAESVAQEIITAASSAVHALHQINLNTVGPPNDILCSDFFTIDMDYSGNTSNHPSNYVPDDETQEANAHTNKDQNKSSKSAQWFKLTADAASSSNNEVQNIVELDAEALLAKYTHYCQVCGKGFKRDANLRMHMRAHGDEYKTTAALTNPIKPANCVKEPGSSPKYSCPQEGCRWNKRHPRFTPLKSMVCVKNHYKRTHCPKMYVCKRCNLKQFSVLSDLRTHEKHCGELRWRCSCGTFFSRKDKLMGHVALFAGHKPFN